MYVFTSKRGSLICHTKHPSSGAVIHRQQTIHWIFTQIRKLSSNYRHKPIVTYWALKKRQAGCLRFMRNTNL